MDELLTDQQQADRARRWLRENGGFILGGVLLGLAALYGWNWWSNYRHHHAEEASAAYEQVLGAVRAGKPVRAAELENELEAQFGDSPYVDQARLALAKLHMDRNEPDEAAAYLSRIVTDSGDKFIKPIARLRLARVRLQQQRYDEALQALAELDENSAFATRFHEIRGDIYVAEGKLADARKQYEEALNAVEPGVIDRNYVQAKLDAIAAAPDEQPAGDETGSKEPPSPPKAGQ